MGRDCVTGAIMMADAVLLGALAMKLMDLVARRIVPDPGNPNVFGFVAYGVSRESPVKARASSSRGTSLRTIA